MAQNIKLPIRYDVQCLYKETGNRPEEWRNWLSNMHLENARVVLSNGKRLAKNDNCQFTDCRLVEVSRKVI